MEEWWRQMRHLPSELRLYIPALRLFIRYWRWMNSLVGGVGDGGVVEADAALAVGVALVAEGVLDGGHGAGGGGGDGEAVVLRVAARDRVAADEVGHGLVGGGAELVLSSLGGLEEHVGVAVAVELARALAREADVVTALE